MMIVHFVIRNFRGTFSSVEMLKAYMLISRNAEAVHGKRKVGNPSASKELQSQMLNTRIVLLHAQTNKH